MGLSIALQSETGERSGRVADGQNLLAHLLGYPDEDEYPMLASIDYYGDTVFNRMQIKRFLAEWKTLASNAKTQEDRDLLQAVERLAHECQSSVHQYLVFVGD
jgi:hypothetical protein